jgi:hypothetical protein
MSAEETNFPERQNFLVNSPKDPSVAFEKLPSLEEVLGNETNLAHAKSLESFHDSLSEVNQWKERLHTSRSQGVGFAAPGGFFTRSLYEAILLKTIPGAEIIPHLKGRPMIELGAGMYHYGWMIASACFASAYIGIEPFYADKLAISVQAAEEKYKGKYPIPKSTILPQDMKGALENLPDNSANIIACGIEDCIMPDKNYRQIVEKHILRILPPDGIFINFQTDIHPKGLHLTQRKIKRVDSPHQDNLCLYRN